MNDCYVIKRANGTSENLNDMMHSEATLVAQVEQANALYMIAGSLLRFEQLFRRSDARYDEMNEQEKAEYEREEARTMAAPVNMQSW